MIDENQLRLNLEFLKNKSLFFLKNKWIIDITKEFNFISNISIKKIYPGTIKVKIIEKKPIAIQVVKQKKFYIAENNKLLDYKESNLYRNLPIVFGKQKDFSLFLNDLRKINFKIEEIKSFYYFDIGRWDIKLLNNKTIKLPKKNYIQSLENYMLLNKDKNFKKYNNFDYRIINQLILK